MSRFMDLWFGLTLLIVGLSHAVRPDLWADFFHALRRTGVAPFIIGMYTLPIGLVLLIGHNLWVWDWPVVATVAGWGMTIKSTLYFLVPSVSDPLLERAEGWRNGWSAFRVVGLLMVVLGTGLAWHALSHGPI